MRVCCERTLTDRDALIAIDKSDLLGMMVKNDNGTNRAQRRQVKDSRSY